MMMCGVDEAGRGPMFGPLVIGAVFCEDDSVLQSIGVKDSKKLTAKARERLYDEISDAVPMWVTVPISAEEIDSQMKVKSLNMIELDLFVEAVMKHPADVVYADCPDVNTERFGNIMSTKTDGRRVIAAHKADALYPVVSAASIMAKVTRDRMLDDLRNEFDCDIGSGYPSDKTTVEFIEKWIKENNIAPPHTRTSWEPVKKMLSSKRMTKISDW
ncbi:MAG: ribonuclease HII [archaeon]|nr:ribonuclease HII [archaeon]